MCLCEISYGRTGINQRTVKGLVVYIRFFLTARRPAQYACKPGVRQPAQLPSCAVQPSLRLPPAAHRPLRSSCGTISSNARALAASHSVIEPATCNLQPQTIAHRSKVPTQTGRGRTNRQGEDQEPPRPGPACPGHALARRYEPAKVHRSYFSANFKHKL